MHVARRTWWIVVAAVPTMVIALVAAFVLMRFLCIHDQLGVWRVTMLDDHGHEVGHGRIDLIAEKWMMRRSWEWPFITFRVSVFEDCGTFTFERPVADDLEKQWDGHWTWHDVPVTVGPIRRESQEARLEMRMDSETWVSMWVGLQEGKRSDCCTMTAAYHVQTGDVSRYCTEMHR